jgi:MOSC domain-containing protein
MPSVDAGVVTAIARYPVKSMLGESLPEVRVEPRGLAGDRAWAVVDQHGKLGSGKNSRRFRRMDGLLDYRGRLDGDGRLRVTTPEGETLDGRDPQLAAQIGERLGFEVSIRAEAGTMHFDEGPVSLLTTASLRSISAAHAAAVDLRRFRANLVVELAGGGYPEDGWVGRRIAVGAALLTGRNRLQRCVVVVLPQEELGADDRLLKTVADAHDLDLGLVADVVRPGTVQVGDRVRVL